MKKLFLDANAHVPMSKSAMKAYFDFEQSDGGWGNPNTSTEIGQKASTVIEESRQKIAELLVVKGNNIYFTRGATEACQWAIEIMKSVCGKNYYSAVEHVAVREPAENDYWEDIPVDSNGVITRFNFKHNGYKVGASVIHVQNEIGIIEPIEKIEADVIFSDMCQSIGKIPVQLDKVDIAVMGAHKFGGPTGVAILYLKDTGFWRPFGTGSRYYMDSPGTPPAGAICAMAAGLSESLLTLQERRDRCDVFQKELEDRLIDAGIKIIGYGVNRINNTTFIKLPKIALLVLMDLSNIGIYCGLGSACSKVGHASKTLNAIGEDSDTDSYLRISQHGEYGKEEAIYFFDCLIKSIKKFK